ncbi:MAG: Gfo/Idh/MocA family protein, partial [Pirellulaceae bacterium]
SGLCLRYSFGFQELMRRLHDGAIGELRVLQANDFRGPIWVKPRESHWSDMEWQMRNWYYFTWLSGDFNVEQHVHFLDVCAWALNGRYPARAVGTGGRQVRTGPEYGHIYDHFSIIYEYEDGVRLFSHCSQQPGCRNDMSAHAFGSLGTALLSERKLAISGPHAWEHRGRDNNIYQTEHDELFRSIRQATPINNGDYMCRSTLLAILGRMAAYTGQSISWDEAFQSQEDLTPPQYAWGPLATPAVAIPGVTKFT